MTQVMKDGQRDTQIQYRQPYRQIERYIQIEGDRWRQLQIDRDRYRQVFTENIQEDGDRYRYVQTVNIVGEREIVSQSETERELECGLKQTTYLVNVNYDGEVTPSFLSF